MRVLVTGGAGYIGSHVVRELIESGHQSVVLDDLSNGHLASVPAGTQFVRGNVGDRSLLLSVLRRFKIDAVMHLAAYSEVFESVENPYKYYTNNFSNSLVLLSAMKDCGVKRFVFSSTAAVYGLPEVMPVEESQAAAPMNPYGRSKRMTELAAEDFSMAHGFGYISLRYFNVAGAHPDGSIGEDHLPESHLIPRALAVAAGLEPTLKVFGTDYPTFDGTCIRDYIHVVDVARAHVLALEKMKLGEGEIYNLGSENGFSVRQVIAACEQVTGQKLNLSFEARREGDPTILIARSARIRADLGWHPRYPKLDDIVEHAWRWHAKHPHGYNDRAAQVIQFKI